MVSVVLAQGLRVHQAYKAPSCVNHDRKLLPQAHPVIPNKMMKIIHVFATSSHNVYCRTGCNCECVIIANSEGFFHYIHKVCCFYIQDLLSS